MIRLDQAYAILDTVIEPVQTPVTIIKTTAALGYVVANDQFSRLDLPPFDKSAMDGYAILANDSQQQFKVLETVPAGRVPHFVLSSGTAIKIMTGAPIPQGAGLVVPVEYATEAAGIVTFYDDYPRRENIARCGEDVRAGDLIVARGTVVTPIIIANLIACGITEIAVQPKLKVAIASTGNEVVTDYTKLMPGKIMDSNEPMLTALCQKFNMEVVATAQVIDDFAKTVTLLKSLENMVDLILLSGGVSVGDFDFVEQALLAANYQIHFNSVAIKPGKPVTFAACANKVVFALPGNPCSAYLTFYLFVLRAYRQMLQVNEHEHYCLLPLKTSWQRKDVTRTDFVPCTIAENGELVAIKSHGSADLAALLNADGFFMVPAGAQKIAAGEKVQMYRFFY